MSDARMSSPPRACFAALTLCAGIGLGAAELPLPARPHDAPGGAAIVRHIAGLDREAREEFILAEVRRGNVPDFWRRFATVPVAGGSIEVAPDYLAVGSDEDHFLAPLTDHGAQRMAEALDCVLPTRKMVDLIWRAAPLKLEPRPIAPSEAMTTVPAMAAHNGMVGEQRRAALPSHPPGTLVAGHKKDVVRTPRLEHWPGRVAIYGWHRTDGTAIQPLSWVHDYRYVDYSHGVRLVRRALTLRGRPTTVETVLADDADWTVLGDEGPYTVQRHGMFSSVHPSALGEVWSDFHVRDDVRVRCSRPEPHPEGGRARVVLYALPAGNTIEQTIGRKTEEGDDWHFDIQHIGAQTRWLRARGGRPDLTVWYLESEGRSWVQWCRAQADGRRSGELVNLARTMRHQPRITLASHSAGGALVFNYLDGVASIPDDIERIAFLDSNYAYDPGKGHGDKLAAWLEAAPERHLCVLAYEDHRALLDGRTFVSEAGGTGGRSRAMLADLGRRFAFTVTEEGGDLERHSALGGRVTFLLKRNPEQKVWHTRQVELNGFIEAMLSGTAEAGRGYRYLAGRVYGEFIAPARK